MEKNKPKGLGELIQEEKPDFKKEKEIALKEHLDRLNRAERETIPIVKIKRLDKDMPLPEYQTKGAAGFDLCCSEFIVLSPGRPTIVPTGICIALQPGYEAQIRPRSGLAAKDSVTVLNTPGTIDSDYRGEIKVILFGFGQYDIPFEKGTRIAQMVIKPAPQAQLEEVEELDETERGDGGFGSTGK